MKNTLRKIALLFFVLAVLVGLSPRFLALDAIQVALNERLSRGLNSNVAIRNIDWKWLPAPHISLTGIDISSNDARLKLPEIKIYPHWKMIYDARHLPEKFHLENPEIFLQIRPSPKDESPEAVFQKTDFYIRNGTLTVQAGEDETRKTTLSFAYGDFSVKKSATHFLLDIRELAVKDPWVTLSGKIEKKAAPGNNQPTDPVPAEPVWTLDLKGRNLDLTGIRKGILTLWKDHKVAKTVCSIVLGGRAKTGSYYFSGVLADFKKLDSMIIEAEPIDADIHVPGAELDLTGAGGPILIRDSLLTGEGLSARMGDSFGSNAKLYLDLSRRSRDFNLDIDIEADLTALPPVLEQLVDHKGFLQELSRFSNVSGRAFGNLSLGDSLDKIQTRVNISEMQVTARYDRLPDTVYIKEGKLEVNPENVSWQKVQGRTGMQEVRSSSGNVSWDTGTTEMHISEIRGKVNGKSFYAMLDRIGMMPQIIDDNLSYLHGSIEISRGSLKGRPLEPETWKYDFSVHGKELVFASTLLPEPATVGKITAKLDNNHVDIKEAELFLFNQPLGLEGKLHHRKLGSWQGIVELNGPVYAGLADWVSSMGWFSEKLRPKIPCTVENMKVSFGNEKIGLQGNLIQGISGARRPMATVDLETTAKYLKINDLTFHGSGEQGSLTLESRVLPSKSLSLTWQGFVKADTIDALFHHSAFSSGSFSGVLFEISYIADQPEATRSKGVLQAENLLLKDTDADESRIIVNEVILNGIGEKLQITSMDISAGDEEVSASGHLTAAPHGLEFDLELASGSLSKTSLDRLTSTLRKRGKSIPADDDREKAFTLIPDNWGLSGRIGYAFDSFSASRETETLYSGKRAVLYTLKDMRGNFELTPDGLSRTEIKSSLLCGLDFNSAWYSEESLGQHFRLATGYYPALRLEEVLPCLGVKQDLLEGEFSLKASLRKESGAWHSGNIHLKSTEGRILRMTLLSRIFAVVNITDLLVTKAGASGKKGFPYTRMDIDAHINENVLIFDRAILHGEGLNLFMEGKVRLKDNNADLTLLVAPFKTIDSLFSKVPIIGENLMKEYDSLVAIPISVKGRLPDPEITPLHPGAVGGAILNVFRETLKLPYNILRPNDRPKLKEEEPREQEQ